jgi:hypothetical protein
MYMARKSRASMEKNNRERAKREKHQEKQARRLERKAQRRSSDDGVQ